MTQTTTASSAETQSRTTAAAAAQGQPGLSPATGSQALDTTKGEEKRTVVLERSTAGANSASGQERDRLLFGEEIPEGKDRGSQLEVEGSPKADFPQHTAQKPQGAQAEPAVMALNGTLALGMVPSPTGPIPADRTTALGIEQGVLADAHKGQFGVKLDPSVPLEESFLRTLDRTTIRSIAHDRGYDLPLRGGGATREMFLQKQKADARFEGKLDAGGGAKREVPEEKIEEAPPAPPQGTSPVTPPAPPAPSAPPAMA